ncbi:putative diphthine synthase [Neospora caninum Liverpool]|uniref:diphthine methyl ester synthase n=1 Tax=Neospora caninum (strain Liverpool) TaxID=572307 RepID=F0VR31_NEOCL|nr:putative diphthine synthase [Neospora caninum Liverpool]CBZ56178.1 putative diphthine synthase [Neospora caninum Liverpool]CEL70936.1 TPA: diphthine synthase, putative [Neospora caninum Liverpool]|eukprot:XP_003886204.1 putative diphthine synthase [Neospora caninum Liverpool]
MVLIIVGLGLSDERDITVKGLEEVKNADFVYLEAYTAVLGVGPQKLEEFFGKKIIEADRTFVEQGSDEMLDRALSSNVAFLVVGDPFCATTHADLYLRARRKNVTVKVVHNASIMNAIGSCGLQLYRFGETVSIPFFEESWRPDSFYMKIKKNKDAGFHTLCLLDIKTKEQTVENMMRGRQIYEPPRFMSVQTAIRQLLEVEDKLGEKVCARDAKAFGLARIGAASQQITSGTLEALLSVDFGPPLHSLVICAPTLHEMETEFFELFQSSDKPAADA